MDASKNHDMSCFLWDRTSDLVEKDLNHDFFFPLNPTKKNPRIFPSIPRNPLKQRFNPQFSRAQKPSPKGVGNFTQQYLYDQCKEIPRKKRERKIAEMNHNWKRESFSTKGESRSREE